MIVQGILFAVATIAAWILAQMLILKKIDRLRHLRWMCVMYLGSLMLYFWAFVCFAPVISWDEFGLWNGALVHILLFCTFMEFYFYVDRPVTLRILVEIYNNPSRSLELNTLNNLYDLRYMIERRLGSLVNSGYMIQEDTTYYLTQKGKRFAKLFTWGTSLLGNKR